MFRLLHERNFERMLIKAQQRYKPEDKLTVVPLLPNKDQKMLTDLIDQATNLMLTKGYAMSFEQLTHWFIERHPETKAKPWTKATWEQFWIIVTSQPLIRAVYRTHRMTRTNKYNSAAKQILFDNLRAIQHNGARFVGYKQLVQEKLFNLADFMDTRYKLQFTNLNAQTSTFPDQVSTHFDLLMPPSQLGQHFNRSCWYNHNGHVQNFDRLRTFTNAYLKSARSKTIVPI